MTLQGPHHVAKQSRTMRESFSARALSKSDLLCETNPISRYSEALPLSFLQPHLSPLAFAPSNPSRTTHDLFLAIFHVIKRHTYAIRL
jgi:hypothetical protein